MDEIEALQKDVRDCVALAYARFRERTDPNNGWVEPRPYVPHPTVYQKKPPPRVKIVSVEEAFDWVLRARELLHRAKPAASPEQILKVWDQYSHHLLYIDDGHFPVEDIAPLNLSVLLLHDVFNLAQRYIAKNHAKQTQQQDAPTQAVEGALSQLTSGPRRDGTPWGMIKKLATKKAGHVKAASIQQDKGIHFLAEQHIYIKSLTTEEILKRRDTVVAESYPRTYL